MPGDPTEDRIEMQPGGDPVIGAEHAARLLGVPLPRFQEDLRAGRVFSVVERGEGEDAGRMRLTLRWRAAEVRLTVEAATGRVITVERPGPSQAPPPRGR
jgi:hypothetical protein